MSQLLSLRKCSQPPYHLRPGGDNAALATIISVRLSAPFSMPRKICFVLGRSSPGHLLAIERREIRDEGFGNIRSEEHTSELQSLMRISYAVFCLKKKKNTTIYKYMR